MADWQVPPGIDKVRPKGTRKLSLGIALGFGALVVIGGCASDSDQVTRALEVLGADSLTLDSETRQELDRFGETYNQYASVTDGDDLDYFRFALRRVKTSYVKPVPDQALIDAAIDGVTEGDTKLASLGSGDVVERGLRGMLRSLDPHSDYLNAEEFSELLTSNQGQFGGLGIEVTMEEGFVRVVAPIEDTPAARAGIQAGDLITHVDGEPIQGKTLREAVELMRGPPNSDINIIVRRDGVEDFPVTITRAIIKVEAVKWQRIRDIGYVRVTRFTEKVEDGIPLALADLSSAAGPPLKGIVLDLRVNPGGLLDQSVILADSFLDEGEIVSVRGRTADNIRSYRSSPGDLARDIPIVVLINGGSASASEIVASALQHHDRAIVMGRQSFGKGSVQTIMPLPGHGALRLTTALYYAPSGHTIQAKGVTPDIFVKPKELLERRSEADLPGALAGEEGLKISNTTLTGETPNIVLEENCPVIAMPFPPAAEDPVLGCALKYLEAGSASQFLAEMKATPAG